MLTDFPLMFWRHRIYPSAVIHIGAHEGQEADFYSKYCPGDIYWFEAIPKVHARLVANISKYPNNRATCACLSDVDGQEVQFNVASNGQSSSMLQFSEHAKEHPDVRMIGTLKFQTVRCATLLDQFAYDLPMGTFLNIDVQGAEGKVIAGMGHYLDRVSHIYSEFNEREMYIGCTMEPELDALLGKYGFETIDRWPTRHGWGDKLYKRKGTL